MVTFLTSALASGQIALMCGQNAPSRENSWSVSSQSFSSDTDVTVFETLATPIGLSTVHFTLGCVRLPRRTGPALGSRGHDLALVQDLEGIAAGEFSVALPMDDRCPFVEIVRADLGRDGDFRHLLPQTRRSLCGPVSRNRTTRGSNRRCGK